MSLHLFSTVLIHSQITQLLIQLFANLEWVMLTQSIVADHLVAFPLFAKGLKS